MLLAIDIGNTSIVLGAYRDVNLVASWCLSTDVRRMPDEYAVLIDRLFALSSLRFSDIEEAVLCCVVPPLATTFEEFCRRYLRASPIQVGPGTRTGIRILCENPREVGADRIVNVVAAQRKYGGPAIIVDFGTGTTFDALSGNGEYLGGAIAPGIGVAADALVKRAAKLQRIELVRPPAAIGRNTVHSMQAGILLGYVGLVEGLVARFKEEMGEARVIATGGLAELVARETRVIEVVDQELTLDGLRMIAQLNAGGRS